MYIGVLFIKSIDGYIGHIILKMEIVYNKKIELLAIRKSTEYV